MSKVFYLLLSLLVIDLALSDELLKNKLEDFERFNKVLTLIEEQYYQKVDHSILMKGAIQGMLETLDPHSSFLDKDLLEKMSEETKGEFGGVGIEVSARSGVIIITAVLQGTPAGRAGIEVGDKIVEINGQSAIGMRLFDAVEAMKGNVGEKLQLGLKSKQGEKIKRVKMIREMIQINPVKYALIDDVLYLQLKQFQEQSTEKLLSALEKVQDHNKKKGLILDLRGNPGGLLEQAVNVSSVFLESGVVVSTESRSPQDKDIRYVKKTIPKDLTTPLVILVDSTSASASEIVAGAIQDYKRGLILGQTTFGKGSVQSVIQLDDQNAIKLTISQYLTPLKRKIQAIGIAPDVILAEEAKNQVVREKDLQNHLSAALEQDQSKEEMGVKFSELGVKVQKIDVKKIQVHSKDLTVQNMQEDEALQSAIALLKSKQYSKILKGE